MGHELLEIRESPTELTLARSDRHGAEHLHGVHQEPGRVLLRIGIREETAVIDHDHLAVARSNAVHETGPPGQAPFGRVSPAGTGLAFDVGRGQDDELVGFLEGIA